VIAPTRPAELIRSGKQGIDFGRVRKWTNVRVKRLLGWRAHAESEQNGRVLESRISKKE